MKRILFAAAAVAALAAPAFAQYDDQDAKIFTLGAGLTVPTGNLKDTAKSSIAGQASLTSPLNGPISWRLEAGYDKFKDKLCTTCDSAKILRFSGGLQVSGGGESSVIPYALVTAGAFSLKEAGLSETRFGLSFGAGLNFKAGDNWGFGIDAHLNMRTAPSGASSSWWFTPTGQVYFKL